MIELPMKNCGMCGDISCSMFQQSVQSGIKKYTDCPFVHNGDLNNMDMSANFSETDLHGNVYDFLLTPANNEISARKIIRPFRADLIDKLAIVKGDYIMGRPMGAGCPVTHVLKVYNVDELSGVLYTWAVGPAFSRNGEVKDIRAYAMTGFEGIAKNIKVYPQIGKTAGFMPSFCMLRLTHYGLVNELLNTSEGLLIRIEDIHIAR